MRELMLLLRQLWRPRSAGPHHPGPLLPASPPPAGRRGRNTIKDGLLEPSLSRQEGGEDGRERVGRVRAAPTGRHSPAGKADRVEPTTTSGIPPDPPSAPRSGAAQSARRSG